MKLHRALLILFSLSITLYFLLIAQGCANMIPPSGGPRDSLPPTLVNVNPSDSARNFGGKKITFVFDEFVQLDNVQANVLISPTPKVFPTINARLRTLTVDLKDTLEPNTTYTIDFGNAIRDINEQNAIRNFTYLFSTGSSLDSFELTGKVILAESGETDSTLIVLLHRNLDDSAVIKERPRYRARLDGNGNFRFRNLPAGTFAVYALKDEGSAMYLQKTQLFAFLQAPVTINSSTEPVTLFAYSAPDPRPTTPAARAITVRTSPSAQERRLRLDANLVDGELDLLKNLEINFPSAPLKYFDSSKVRFVNENFSPLTGYRYLRDTSNQKISLQYNWVANTQYHLIVDKDFAEDSSGRKLLKLDTLSFKTRKENEYGEVRLRFPNIDLQKNPVLLFMQNNSIAHTHIFTSNTFNARLFRPGEYELRILYDENKNGKWDPGEFFTMRRQPEKVLSIPRRVIIKPNWLNEVDINL